MIAGNHGRVASSILARLLTCRTAVWIGLLSYSLYLWHWPVFSIFRWTVGFATPALKLSALAIAIGLSLISYFLIERPIRAWHRPRVPVLAVSAYVVAVLVCAGAVDRLLRHSTYLSASTVNGNRENWYPGYKNGEVGEECHIEWRQAPLLVGSGLIGSRVHCDTPIGDLKAGDGVLLPSLRVPRFLSDPGPRVEIIVIPLLAQGERRRTRGQGTQGYRRQMPHIPKD